jgi:hypothetical protein
VSVTGISPAECSEIAARALDVDDAADLFSAEGLAASLRRAASYLCPASPQQVTNAVLDALRPLAPSGGLQRAEIADLLDLLVSGGDLIELPRPGSGSARLLYLGPPSYVEARPGRYLLTGIRPFGTPLISTSLADGVQYEGHTRAIDLSPGQAAHRLAEAGLHRIRRELWVQRPADVPAADLVNRMRKRLSACRPTGQMDGLTVIGQDTGGTYYRGRWRPLAPADSGMLVGRRPQAYGADAWCVVQADGGTPTRFIDLPADDPDVPGHDEAWRVQAALDAERGTPQVFRVSDTARAGGATVDFFSPLPRWAERRLQLAGMTVPKSRGALFSYRVPADALPDLAGFLASMLWMNRTTTEGAE